MREAHIAFDKSAEIARADIAKIPERLNAVKVAAAASGENHLTAKQIVLALRAI
jgi:hypothetical protein